MGKHAQALPYFEKAFGIRQQSLPPNHPDLAGDYNNIGFIHKSMGDYSKARSYYERAVNIGQKSLPSNHPNLKKWINSLDSIKGKL
jgi:tetratricopeptide (TPR) repeat protein